VNHTTDNIRDESPSFVHSASFVFICLSVIKLAAPWFLPHFNFLCELRTGCPQTPVLSSESLQGDSIEQSDLIG
jgi:hypothetical protein